ncbi:DUF6238 family protein [Streptomyces acidiscabies]|nr:DUF6238 family protein [Streptomyces acidiscabies]MBP5941177.1 hypothetical protein [Streptomyces sp. LBUM 1476]MBZ3912505.1 hypothetical protein [Streptomyces acidiscabies]GAQ59628.1 hypothetical protein a10_09534 [Streptomyces acidiscabies]
MRPREPGGGGGEFLPFATAALDLHRTLAVPDGPLVADPGELDTLHAHAVALLRLIDVHSERARPISELAVPLRTARIRAWQVADLLHHASHTTPAPVPRPADRAVCRRHQDALRLIRRRTTPADLRTQRDPR